MNAVATDFGRPSPAETALAARAGELWRRPEVQWWALMVGLYLVTRLALFWRFPAFWDEGFYAVQAQTGLDNPATRFSELADGKGPLFHWISIAFVGAGISPLDAVRLISLLAGVSALTTTALIARRLGRTAGLVAPALYVLMPYFLVHDVHGLVDPLLSALLSAALLLEIQQAERPRLDRAFALGLVLGAAWLTRDLGLLGLLLLPLSLLCFDFSAASIRERLGRWAGCSLVSLALAAVCHAIVYLSPIHAQNPPGQTRSLSSVLSSPFKYFSPIWPDVRGILAGYIGIPLLLLAIGVVVAAVRRRHRLLALLAVWGMLPFVAMMLFTQFGYPRYALPAIPPLTALLAFGLAGLWQSMPRWLSSVRSGWLSGGTAVPVVTGVVVAALLILPLRLDARVLINPGTATFPGEDDYQFAAGWPSGTGLDVIGSALGRLAGPGQAIVAAVDFTPWNLAVRFDHPVRVPLGGAVPDQDGVTASVSSGRTLYFVPYGSPASYGARFLLTQSVFPTPPALDLSRYRLVVAYQRPAGAVVQGNPQPVSIVELYELAG